MLSCHNLKLEMDELKEEIMDFFVSFFLKKEEALGDQNKTKRKLAKHMLKMKPVQKVILNSIVQLYPIITEEVIKERFGFYNPKDQELKALTDKSASLAKDFSSSATRDGKKILGVYKNITEKLSVVKDVISEFVKHDLLSKDEDISQNPSALKISNKLVKHLSQMSQYEPAFYLDIRDISTEN